MQPKLLTRIAWVVVCLLSVVFAGYGLVTALAVARAPGEAGPASFLVLPSLGVTHAAAGAVALAVGAFQFLRPVQRRLALHRLLGRIYAVGVGVSGLAGLRLALDSAGGLTTALGFGGLAVAWLTTLAVGLAAIGRRRIARHRAWMIRCFALTFAAVMLRLDLAFSMAVLGMEFEPSFRIASFACWVPNLLAAEWWIRRGGRRGVPALSGPADGGLPARG